MKLISLNLDIAGAPLYIPAEHADKADKIRKFLLKEPPKVNPRVANAMPEGWEKFFNRKCQ